MKSEKGTSLLEVLIALALLGIIGVLFMNTAMDSAHARVQVDERTSARILAETVIDSVKKMDFSASYTVTVPDDYPRYTADLEVVYLDGNALQKITVSIGRDGREILTLENYKVNR